MERKGVWRWLHIKQGSWAMKLKVKEVQKLVLWELSINLASMHGEKGLQSPGKRATSRKGLSLCSPQESCGISPQAAPASEGPLLQIRAVFHMCDPETSASRAEPRHELHRVMS